MSVLVDAAGGVDFVWTALTTKGGTPFSTNNITAAATAMSATVAFDNTTANISNLTATFGNASPPSMTVPATPGAFNSANIGGAHFGDTYILGITAPVTGSPTLTLTWTTAANGYAAGVSWKGTDTVNPFKNGTGTSATSAAPSITVNSPTGDFSIGILGSFDGVTVSSMNQTTLFLDNSGSFGNAASNYTAGAGASTTLSGVLASSVIWSYAACDVQAPSSLATTLTGKEQKILLPGTGPSRGLQALRAFTPPPAGVIDTAGSTIFRVQRPTWR